MGEPSAKGAQLSAKKRGELLEEFAQLGAGYLAPFRGAEIRAMDLGALFPHRDAEFADYLCCNKLKPSPCRSTMIHAKSIRACLLPISPPPPLLSSLLLLLLPPISPPPHPFPPSFHDSRMSHGAAAWQGLRFVTGQAYLKFGFSIEGEECKVPGKNKKVTESGQESLLLGSLFVFVKKRVEQVDTIAFVGLVVGFIVQSDQFSRSATPRCPVGFW